MWPPPSECATEGKAAPAIVEEAAPTNSPADLPKTPSTTRSNIDPIAVAGMTLATTELNHLSAAANDFSVPHHGPAKGIKSGEDAGAEGQEKSHFGPPVLSHQFKKSSDDDLRSRLADVLSLEHIGFRHSSRHPPPPKRAEGGVRVEAHGDRLRGNEAEKSGEPAGSHVARVFGGENNGETGTASQSSEKPARPSSIEPGETLLFRRRQSIGSSIAAPPAREEKGPARRTSTNTRGAIKVRHAWNDLDTLPHRVNKLAEPQELSPDSLTAGLLPTPAAGSSLPANEILVTEEVVLERTAHPNKDEIVLWEKGESSATSLGASEHGDGEIICLAESAEGRAMPKVRPAVHGQEASSPEPVLKQTMIPRKSVASAGSQSFVAGPDVEDHSTQAPGVEPAH